MTKQQKVDQQDFGPDGDPLAGSGFEEETANPEFPEGPFEGDESE